MSFPSVYKSTVDFERRAVPALGICSVTISSEFPETLHVNPAFSNCFFASATVLFTTFGSSKVSLLLPSSVTSDGISKYGNTSFNTLMQFAGAVGTSVCAALVSSAQSMDNSMNFAEKTASGSTHSFIFLLILAVACLALQVIGFKTYKEN